MLKMSVLAAAVLAMAGLANAAAIVIPNGDFQSGDFTNWTPNGATIGTDGAGNYYAVDSVGSSSSSLAESYSLLSLVTGTTYTASFDAMCLNDTGAAEIDVALMKAWGGSVSLATLHGGSAGLTVANGWQHYSTTFTYTDASPVGWIVWNAEGAGGHDVAFDNFAITPEPATMSVLALGGLMAIRRRRNA